MHSALPIRIAYADDHDIVRNGICELLNASSQRCQVVIQAGNGEELIERLAGSAEPVDVCILDIFMPVLNGFETLKAIRLRWPEMRVLVLTGHNTDYYLIKMIMAGANGYLLKNCSPKELDTALISIYENGIYHSEVMTLKFFQAVIHKEVKLPLFTEHEVELLKHCCSDLSYVQIADKMGVTAKSVDWYRESLFKKLKVGSRSGLVMCAIRFGIIPMDIDTTGHIK